MSKRLAVLFAAVTLTATSALAQAKDVQDKKIETILGTWKIQKVLSGNTEVAKNPTSGQWIEFKNNGRYVNHTASVDSGSFRLNENHSTLYLESQLQPDAAKIVEWTIALTDNTLTMEPAVAGNKSKKSNKDKMKYVYVRIEKGSNKLNN
ncbi:MAG: hypothetical protein QM762_07115 [Chryseolinea sp.]